MPLSFEEISFFKNDIYTIKISELWNIDTVQCTVVGVNVGISSVVTKITQSVSQKFYELLTFSQPAFTFSNLTIETLEQGVKYVQR